ncbi:MAG: PhzF family phenazine biosynthesis protein [Desulfobacteraceae bacterium]|nr:PhzF family phenazine biosynthesis protein [Desulfobacteraceae bacterium]
MMEIFQVDSFTTEAFRGNPAGVCILDEHHDDRLLRKIAMEMAVSETAFISLENMSLRWFTPRVEVELCGHATLATAWVLYCKGIIRENQLVKFNTRSGELTVRVKDGYVEMDFPLIKVEQRSKLDGTKTALLGINEHNIVFYGNAGEKDFFEVESVETLRNIRPDFSGLSNLPGRGIVVTSKSNDTRYDFFSRYFAPWVGVNEDPVTGSTHCALAYYWNKKFNRVKMAGYQASERGGVVIIKIVDHKRVKLSGNATIVIEGKILI